MRASKLRRAAVPLIGVASAPLGHLVAYEVRLGPAAWNAESSAAHTYFPALAAILAASLGAGLLVSLFILAAARLVAARRGRFRTDGRRWPVIDLLAVLFTVQLAVFLVQEGAEALVSGSAIAPLPGLLLWGVLGQLPVAAAVALALSWLSVRLAVAIGRLRGSAGRFRPKPEPWTRRFTPVAGDDPIRTSALGAFAKRGPPAFLLDSAIA